MREKKNFVEKKRRNYIFFPPCGLSVLEVEVEWKVVSVFYVNFVWFFNISRLVLSLLILKKKESRGGGRI